MQSSHARYHGSSAVAAHGMHVFHVHARRFRHELNSSREEGKLKWPVTNRSQPTDSMLKRARGRTAEGKARVGSNALKHGLTGKQIVLPNEDPEEFDTFRAGLLNALQPHDELEGSLAERFIIDEWRLRRIPVLEAAVYRRDRRDSIIANQEREVRQYEYTEMSSE